MVLLIVVVSANILSAQNRYSSIKRGNVAIGKTVAGSKLAVVGLPVYADNAGALGGALTAGDFYRTATGAVMVTF